MARIQKVNVTQSDVQRAVVDQGLAADDKVVIDGQYRLTAGSKVVEAKSPASGARP
jgi:hypothetical protein